MLIKRASDIRSSDITPKELYLKRREFIRSTALGAAGIAAGALASGSSTMVEAQGQGEALQNVRKGSAFDTDEKLTPYSDVTRYNNFYEFGTDKSDPARRSGKFQPRPWTIRVDGECNKPGEIGLEDLIGAHTLEERIYRLRCVEAWSMVVPWIGIPMADVLNRFEPNGNARFVRFETVVRPDEMPGQKTRIVDWPYVEGLRMDEATNPLAIFGVGLYGEVLPNQNGAPLRIVIPWKYGFKSIKSIVRISFVRQMPLNTWKALQPSEYGFYANVNPEVDHPRWSQASERRIDGSFFPKRIDTMMFNGYAEQVGSLYAGMDLRTNY
ncbi:protein-methionine-sulfoxide reductase catalytic subunit MsrP [Gemmatimonadota bacterium]